MGAHDRQRVAAAFRCKGDEHEDCGRRASGAVCAWGYVDSAFTKPEVGYIVIPVCDRHRGRVLRFAEQRWGALDEPMWVEADAIPVILREMGSTERVVLAETKDPGLVGVASA